MWLALKWSHMNKRKALMKKFTFNVIQTVELNETKFDEDTEEV